MTDIELLQRAVEKFRSKRAVAMYLRVSQPTVSGYGRRYPIPKHHRRALMQALGIPQDEEYGTPKALQWYDQEWRAAGAVEKAHRQLEAVHAKGYLWEPIVTLLDAAAPWGDRQWERLWREQQPAQGDDGGGEDGAASVSNDDREAAV